MEPLAQQTLAKGASAMDGNWFLAGFPVLAGIVGWAWKHLNGRISTAEAHSEAERKDIWNAMEKVRDKHDALERNTLTNMATKADLKELKDDLIDAINQRRDTWSPQRRETGHD